MGQARLEKDGTYRGDFACRWCRALIDQGGRRKPRRYCNGWHRTKSYVTNFFAVVLGIFS
ncbi:hypothetical protein [Streptomyces sennicomposti]